MAGGQHTKEQHYVPRVYLQGFSSDARSLFEYNLKADKPIKEPVSIESVCKEKYLYELRDEQGEIINLNYLENVLCQYEGMFADHRRALLKKAVFKENYQTKCFLSKEEKQFWIFYTALQIMRNPSTLRGIKNFILDETHGAFSDQQAQNLAAGLCLPFFQKPNSKVIDAFRFVTSVLMGNVLTVGYTETGNLITSDHAVYGSRKPKEEFPQFQRLWFPVSSNCAIIFSNPDLVGRDGRNRLIPLYEDEIRDMNKGISYIATQVILSKLPFSEEDIALIREARSEKEQDDEQKSFTE